MAAGTQPQRQQRKLPIRLCYFLVHSNVACRGSLARRTWLRPKAPSSSPPSALGSTSPWPRARCVREWMNHHQPTINRPKSWKTLALSWREPTACTACARHETTPKRQRTRATKPDNQLKRLTLACRAPLVQVGPSEPVIISPRRREAPV